MLEVTGLRAGYGAVEVLRGVDLTIGRGDIVALLGSNGVGKTTFNAVLSGLIRPWAGKVAFKGKDITGIGAVSVVDAGMSLVPEGRLIFPNMTVKENLILGSYRRARDNRDANIDMVVAIFPRLKERFEQKAGTLSGGEQQMLAIGRGMMAEPELLILDEPSLGLSPLLVEEMFHLIKRLNEEGLTILLVEQNVAQSLEIATTGYVLENGAISLSGPAATLMDDPNLQRSYLGI
ncbi:ABC transporter ATP-binding protein [Mesorhizobium sp. YIM 152430]|uniref:ABC transporter ATP-binding protein n=1 Tax=Mesorhizobium sp. YIM 152430 TaxID=3031761 RepID=UPI0023DA9E7F|nr:ABC transporter ATP-binding protein [Mesorhizobium sp. YIM 152430]MDF1598926.1 ABC transporter ATP-binding protein [Mesorhizobium sp. YIM 152430]